MLAITLNKFHTIRIEHKGEVITITARNIIGQKARLHIRGSESAVISRTTEHFDEYKKQFERESQIRKNGLLSWAAVNIKEGKE